MKKVLVVGLGVVALVLLPVVLIMVSTFGGLKPLEMKELPGGARQVVDGFVSFDVLPVSEREVALIDCGDDAQGKALLAELQRRGLGPEAVKAIFLTHGHSDHIAACHLFAGAEVMAFAADAAVAEGKGRAKGPLPSMLDTPENKRVKVTRTLSDGETVTLGALSVN